MYGRWVDGSTEADTEGITQSMQGGSHGREGSRGPDVPPEPRAGATKVPPEGCRWLSRLSWRKIRHFNRILAARTGLEPAVAGREIINLLIPRRSDSPPIPRIPRFATSDHANCPVFFVPPQGWTSAPLTRTQHGAPTCYGSSRILMKGMIPPHSIAILTSERAHIKDPDLIPNGPGIFAHLSHPRMHRNDFGCTDLIVVQGTAPRAARCSATSQLWSSFVRTTWLTITSFVPSSPRSTASRARGRASSSTISCASTKRRS
jgi:hypothetical protein